MGTLVLEQYGVRGTYYVSGEGCGAPSPSGPLATIDQLRVLHARGHELGCHTYSHIAVAGVSSHEFAADIAHNRNFLQDIFLQDIGAGIAVRNFAYPYCDYTFCAKRSLQGQFDSCRSLIPGVNSSMADLGLLKTWPLENASADRGKIFDRVAETVRTNGWLIFNCHDVVDEPGRHGVSPDLFAFAAATAREGGCRPVTIAEGLALARGATV